tara:strand:- start:148 stop:864 length:717 start_codon:yes stop_codon:yes gene_type:complete
MGVVAVPQATAASVAAVEAVNRYGNTKEYFGSVPPYSLMMRVSDACIAPDGSRLIEMDPGASDAVKVDAKGDLDCEWDLVLPLCDGIACTVDECCTTSELGAGDVAQTAEAVEDAQVRARRIAAHRCRGLCGDRRWPPSGERRTLAELLRVGLGPQEGSCTWLGNGNFSATGDPPDATAGESDVCARKSGAATGGLWAPCSTPDECNPPPSTDPEAQRIFDESFDLLDASIGIFDFFR